jgi:hypothetical protein
MFNFIFNFFYRYHKKGGTTDPKTSAAIAVAITASFHIFLLANVIYYYTGIKIFGNGYQHDYFYNKLHYLPFAILYVYGFTWYYNHKRAINIVSRWPKDYRVITFKNIILIFIIMFLPLIIGVQFLNHAQF